MGLHRPRISLNFAWALASGKQSVQSQTAAFKLTWTNRYRKNLNKNELIFEYIVCTLQITNWRLWGVSSPHSEEMPFTIQVDPSSRSVQNPFWYDNFAGWQSFVNIKWALELESAHSFCVAGKWINLHLPVTSVLIPACVFSGWQGQSLPVC